MQVPVSICGRRTRAAGTSGTAALGLSALLRLRRRTSRVTMSPSDAAKTGAPSHTKGARYDVFVDTHGVLSATSSAASHVA